MDRIQSTMAQRCKSKEMGKHYVTVRFHEERTLCVNECEHVSQVSCHINNMLHHDDLRPAGIDYPRHPNRPRLPSQAGLRHGKLTIFCSFSPA